MKIFLWSDYACPYCFIGESRLKKGISEIPGGREIEIEYKAFELDPGASKKVVSDTQTRFAKKYGMTSAEALKRIRQIEAAGHAEGLEFNYETTLYTNTFDAHRLMKLALSKIGKNIAEKVNLLLFEAYFGKNLELASNEVLLNIGKDAGLPEGEIQTMLQSDQFADEVRKDESEAARLGVGGVPYFWVPGIFSIPGAISTEQMKDALQEALKAGTAQTISGQSCGIDGCKI